MSHNYTGNFCAICYAETGRSECQLHKEQITDKMLAIIDRYAAREINLAQCLAYLRDAGAPDWLQDAVEGIERGKFEDDPLGQGRN